MPSDEELEDNNRSHSAKLRVAQKNTQVEGIDIAARVREQEHRYCKDRFHVSLEVEKGFYGSIVLTAVILAISIVFYADTNFTSTE